MNPETQQELQTIKSQVDGLKGAVDQLTSLVHHLNTEPSQLDRNIDPNSRDVINRVNQETYKQVSVVVGAAFILLPQSKYIKVSGTAARTSSTTTAITNGTWYGQILYIEGTSNTNTITFKDAANTQLAGDCTLGLYDTLSLIWNGTYWLELKRSNNNSSTSSINARSYGNGATINDATDTKVTLSANSFANGVTWDATNKRLTILTAGQYLVSAFVSYDSAAGGANKLYQVMIFKNGSEATRVNVQSSIASTAISVASTDIYNCAVSDYFEVWTAQYTGGARNIPDNTETASLLVAKV